MQSRSPLPLHPLPDDSPTVRLPRVTRDPGPRPNRLGTVTFVIALLGAVFAVLPSMAALGLFVCFLVVVPAIIAWLRSRDGKAMGHVQASAAVVIAPVFLVVAAVVVGTTAPHPSGTPVPTAEGTVADAGSATQQAPQASPSSVPSPAPVAAAPASGAPAVAHAAPVVAKPHAPAPKPVTVPKVVSPPKVAPPKVAPAPKPASAPVAQSASACDEATHYVNSSGNCVPDPVAAPSAPAGATAQCKDGTYSSSQHRQGTCSGHRGVAKWLDS